MALLEARLVRCCGCWLFIAAAVCITGSAGGDAVNSSGAELRLIRELIRRQSNHRQLARPPGNASDSLAVRFGVALVQILRFDEKNQVIRLLLWKRYEWTDSVLAWNPAEYGGLRTVGLLGDLIWKPDIMLYSHVGMRSAEQHKEAVMVYSDGRINWIPPVVYDSTCDVDMTHFPFDQQTCILKFGSWVYSRDQLDLDFFQGERRLDRSEYIESAEWLIVNDTAEKHALEYPCCPNSTFCDITFTIVLQRKSGFYTAVLLLPAMLLSLLVLVIFWIPPQRPDRTTLGMSVFGSFVILLLVILETAPPSAAISLGSYCCISIILVTIATAFSSIMVNLTTYRRPMPYILRQIIIGCMANKVCLAVTCTQINGLDDVGAHVTKSRDESHCCTCCRHAHPSQAPPNVINGYEKASTVADHDVIQQQPTNHNRDWILMTKVLDRMMFLIYLVAIVLCIVFIFPRPQDY